LGNDFSLAFREGSLDPLGKNVPCPNRITVLDLLALQFSTQTNGQLFGETPADYS
jgi:hypothetical protein